jgi:pimeloyl-ACP methyl ester carboxylesterase
VQVPVLPELLLSRSLETVLRLSGLAGGPARRYAERLSGPADLHGPLAWYRAAARRPPWTLLAVGGNFRDEVNVPTTYVWGRRDPALGRAAAQRTCEHVNGDYLFIELDAGHWLPEMHPHAVAEAVIDRVGHAA